MEKIKLEKVEKNDLECIVKSSLIYSDNRKINISKIPNINNMFRGFVYFDDCIFLNELEIDSIAYHDAQKTNLSVETLLFENCIFRESVLIENKEIKCELIFNNCIFLDEFSLKRTVLTDYCDFSSSIFCKGLNLDATTFDSKVSFKDVSFNKKNKFNLRNSYINEKMDFLDICTRDLKLKINENKNHKDLYNEMVNIRKENFLNVENRETARIIKDSFEQQNNIIEANKFYALEMKKYDETLSWKNNFKDKLIFKLHDWSSEHSQNWLLALFWILILSMGCGFIQNYFLDIKIEFMKPLIANIFGYCFISIAIPLLIDNILENQKLKKYTLSFVFLTIGIYILSTKDLLLELPAKTINPFSFMQDESTINGIELIYKVITAYLIYQLIISIRQNTRRK